jgi:hypothetical protein
MYAPIVAGESWTSSTRCVTDKAGQATVYVAKVGFTNSESVVVTTSGWEDSSDTNT